VKSALTKAKGVSLLATYPLHLRSVTLVDGGELMLSVTVSFDVRYSMIANDAIIYLILRNCEQNTSAAVLHSGLGKHTNVLTC
jgi:hypothetical protein